MREKRKRIIISVVVICAALITLYFIFFREYGVTGNEWFLLQGERMEDVSAFCDEMDDVFTLYIGGYISEDDFRNEEILLRKEFAILKAKYEAKDKEINIITGSHSWASKKGEECLDNIFLHLEEFMSVEYADMDVESVLANYLVLNETLEDDVLTYTVLYQWIADGEFIRNGYIDGEAIENAYPGMEEIENDNTGK